MLAPHTLPGTICHLLGITGALQNFWTKIFAFSKFQMIKKSLGPKTEWQILVNTKQDKESFLKQLQLFQDFVESKYPECLLLRLQELIWKKADKKKLCKKFTHSVMLCFGERCSVKQSLLELPFKGTWTCKYSSVSQQILLIFQVYIILQSFSPLSELLTVQPE